MGLNFMLKKRVSIILNDDFLEEVVGECYDKSLTP